MARQASDKQTDKTARINLYLTEEQRVKIEEAARLAGLSLSSWIRLVALEAADEIIKRKVSKK